MPTTAPPLMPPAARARQRLRGLVAAGLLSLLRVRVRYSASAVAALARGGCLVSCNHVSFLDGFVLALASTRPMAFTSEPLYSRRTWWARLLFRTMITFGYAECVVPLGPDAPHGLRQVLRLIERGVPVVIFPEGAISVDGRPLPQQPGLQWVAQRTGASVVEAAIVGAERSRIFGKDGRAFRPMIEVHF